ncbi:multidrug efflux pump subunit AcrB [Arcticibacter tournemirensis]|uniref:Efflux RND transporter permease subunit n=1 Tax=Arcticibacter tournemirensis TaxID=699437 RepID=A0A5M9H7F7_9SPHI|nr:efflux RND transporter permease subunit [Arcticibacter tournemirensis]KAA8482873.1 efflux RND transporter permease subunit [Arcticibacter tournemirensis]TQM49748.1 multidrug efflux pump subunit AcrB [Arcticibacter tournemirensis]
MKDVNKEFRPSSWAIDNRTAIYVFTCILILAGYFSYNSLPKENFPEVIIPKIFVQTVYPGTSPANMENLITKQLEKEIRGTLGLKKITSNSFQDFSFITAEFNTGVDIKDAKQRVKDAVDKAKVDLPSDLPDEPEVMDINLSDLPIMYINISGDYDLKKLKEYADDIEDRIEGLKEIAGVDIVGALEPEIQINVDLRKMESAQISFDDIGNAVAAENLTISGGAVKMDGMQRTLNIKKEFANADELGNMIVKSQAGGSVYLKDIAEVKDSFKEQNSYARLYGKNVITLNVRKRSGENLIEASDKINAMLAEMKGTVLPSKLDVTITGDQSDQTRVTLHDLINTIIIGFILVTLILMFFMGVTNALFVALSVPLSMFIAFLSMPVLGGVFDFNFTMNMMVLFSFLLGLGIVVDDAIVVVENTHRIFDNGRVPIIQAAKTATGEVFMPVLSGTLTTLAPFFPLLFWPGIIGEFMYFLPVTLIVTLTASLVVAYIINPVFAVDFMKPHDRNPDHKPTFDPTVKKTLIVFVIMAILGYLVNFGLGNFIVLLALLYLLNHFVLTGAIENFQTKVWPKLVNKYNNLLTWALKRPRTMIWSTVGLFFLTMILIAVVPPRIVFFPTADPNFVYVYIELPVGTDQAYTNKIVEKVEQRVEKVVGRNNPDVSSIISNVTVGVTDPQGEDQGEYTNKGKVTVAFVAYGKRTGESTNNYLGKIRDAVKGIPGAQITVAQEQGGPPTAKPISIEITGDDLDSIAVTSDRLKKYLDAKQIAGVEELKSDFQNNKPEIIFDIDRERANREGISTGQVGMALRTALYGKEVSKYRDVNEDYEINVRAREDQRNNLEALRNMKLTYRDMAMNGTIRQVPISSFANIDYVNTYGGIKRKQQKRIIILSSNVLSEYNANEVVANIQREINQFNAPAGVEIKMAGEQEEQMETAAFLMTAMVSALFIILVILVLQFNSISKPVVILSEILFSIIGVLLGITIFGMQLSIVMTGLGIVALAGIVVRNGILLVEFTDLMVEQGMEVREAVMEAGRTRMTPVLLTATATMLGLIPLAVGLNLDFVTLFTEFNPHLYFGGDNVSFWGPLSWTIIFGLSFATFLTLVLVPCMYLVADSNSKRVKKLFKK